MQRVACLWLLDFLLVVPSVASPPLPGALGDRTCQLAAAGVGRVTAFSEAPVLASKQEPFREDLSPA